MNRAFLGGSIGLKVLGQFKLQDPLHLASPGASAALASCGGLEKAGASAVVLANREYAVKRKTRKVAGSMLDGAESCAQAQPDEMSANVERGIQDLPVWQEYVQRFGLAEARKILRRGLLINQLTDGNPQN